MLRSLLWFEIYVPKRLVHRLMARGSAGGIRSVEREVTVMFTDIAGFTSLAEHLSAADAAALLNEHFAMVTSCIEAEGGTVDKFIGDAVMAFWNAPDDQPDHADRACRAALAIRAAIIASNDAAARQGRVPIRLRVGVHSGPAVVGNIGPANRVNYTAIGDVVNTAQRLEALSKELPGMHPETAILVSATTIVRLGAPGGARLVGRFHVKGREAEIEVFTLDDPAG
jgi:adenylate cyclase